MSDNILLDKDLDIEIDKEKQHFLFVNKISLLYDKVFTRYQRGENMVYNPNIFNYLTKELFIDWVIKCNNQ